MGKTYRSAQGKMVDMEALRLKNELVPAIGNMRVNARGDQLGPGGKIVKTREQIMSEYYEAGVGKKTKQANKASDIKADAVQPISNRNRLPTVPGINDEPEVQGIETAVTQSEESTAIATSETSHTQDKPQPRGGLAQAIAKANEQKDSDQ